MIGRELPARPSNTERLVAAIQIATASARSKTIRTDSLAAATGIRAGMIYTYLAREIKARRIACCTVALPGRRPQHDYRLGPNFVSKPATAPVAQPVVARNTGSVSSRAPQIAPLEGHTVATQTPAPARKRRGIGPAAFKASAGDVGPLFKLCQDTGTLGIAGPEIDGLRDSIQLHPAHAARLHDFLSQHKSHLEKHR